ncbi:hypothetical protein Asal01_00594 [Fodinibius salicampi]
MQISIKYIILSSSFSMGLFACLLFTFVFSRPAMSQSASGEIHTVVDVMPEIEGGLSALYKKIKYPQKAISEGISGRVYLQLIVDENGNAQNPEVLRDIGGGCGEAAVEAIKKVKFTPGKQGGKAVKVKYSLPVTFRIEES